MNKVLLAIIAVIVATPFLMFFTRDQTLDNKQESIKPTEGKPPIEEYFPQLEARSDLEKLTVSGGCFWCMEGPFEAIEGVEEVIAGYAGGQVENPSYEQVIAGNTGHRESAQIYFHPDQVTIEQLLDTYFHQIDPTDAEGQFADRGFQYTTAIFTRNEDQKQQAEDFIKKLDQSGKYEQPIVTQVIPFTTFYPAEEYHQDFYINSATRYKLYSKASGRAGYVEENK